MRKNELTQEQKALDELDRAVGMFDDALIELEQVSTDPRVLAKARSLRDEAYKLLIALEKSDERYCVPTNQIGARGIQFYRPKARQTV